MVDDMQTAASFELGEPALVCRWRLAGGRLPLENRHLRALRRREVGGEPVDVALVAWAKQHVEWTLPAGAARHPDGVLMLVVDTNGQAAMTVGPYEGLPDVTLRALGRRARRAELEGVETGISPESLWVVFEGTLLWNVASGAMPSGATSLVEDLAHSVGLVVRRREGLLADLHDGEVVPSEAFLVSDEHGVVVASDCAGSEGRRFREGLERLWEQTRKE
ncbi:hypothetical protein [Olsenella sp. HMSC062G07]|uniref:hypothetical protein n=1 Tax=Olsenella sp. HMSC062G07 TaxID=1739330 RepID=UPI0008A4D82A|nr:hypothetical protein [Olsenella sp. HMSC062G07]OFK25271.1 hypothetical protein HMPREF2826_02915 [Olsenella sp. HMSC062G07]